MTLEAANIDNKEEEIDPGAEYEEEVNRDASVPEYEREREEKEFMQKTKERLKLEAFYVSQGKNPDGTERAKSESPMKSMYVSPMKEQSPVVEKISKYLTTRMSASKKVREEERIQSTINKIAMESTFCITCKGLIIHTCWLTFPSLKSLDTNAHLPNDPPVMFSKISLAKTTVPFICFCTSSETNLISS